MAAVLILWLTSPAGLPYILCLLTLEESSKQFG